MSCKYIIRINPARGLVGRSSEMTKLAAAIQRAEAVVREGIRVKGDGIQDTYKGASMLQTKWSSDC